MQTLLAVAKGLLHDANAFLTAARGFLHAANAFLTVARGLLHDANTFLAAAAGTANPDPRPSREAGAPVALEDGSRAAVADLIPEIAMGALVLRQQALGVVLGQVHDEPLAR
jgi:hypothetical protein